MCRPVFVGKEPGGETLRGRKRVVAVVQEAVRRNTRPIRLR